MKNKSKKKKQNGNKNNKGAACDGRDGGAAILYTICVVGCINEERIRKGEKHVVYFYS